MKEIKLITLAALFLCCIYGVYDIGDQIIYGTYYTSNEWLAYACVTIFLCIASSLIAMLATNRIEERKPKLNVDHAPLFEVSNEKEKEPEPEPVEVNATVDTFERRLYGLEETVKNLASKFRSGVSNDQLSEIMKDVNTLHLPHLNRLRSIEYPDNGVDYQIPIRTIRVFIQWIMIYDQCKMINNAHRYKELMQQRQMIVSDTDSLGITNQDLGGLRHKTKSLLQNYKTRYLVQEAA